MASSVNSEQPPPPRLSFSTRACRRHAPKPPPLFSAVPDFPTDKEDPFIAKPSQHPTHTPALLAPIVLTAPCSLNERAKRDMAPCSTSTRPRGRGARRARPASRPAPRPSCPILSRPVSSPFDDPWTSILDKPAPTKRMRVSDVADLSQLPVDDDGPPRRRRRTVRRSSPLSERSPSPSARSQRLDARPSTPTAEGPHQARDTDASANASEPDVIFPLPVDSRKLRSIRTPPPRFSPERVSFWNLMPRVSDD